MIIFPLRDYELNRRVFFFTADNPLYNPDILISVSNTLQKDKKKKKMSHIWYLNMAFGLHIRECETPLNRRFSFRSVLSSRVMAGDGLTRSILGFAQNS